MLSDRAIKALKPLGKDQMISDGAGLYVRVSKYGSKTFVYREYRDRKTRYLTLGTYPVLSLSDARKRVQELQETSLTDHTLSDAVRAYLTVLDYQHPEQVKARLERDVVPVLGKRRLSTITTIEVSDVVQSIVDRGSPVAANRTLADVKHVFQFAFQKGWVSSDPTARITRRVIGGREKSRARVLSNDEIHELITVMRTDRFEVRTRVALLLLLITGQRASEVLGISKNEVRGAWWTIPPERTKAKRAQKVYLPYVARWLLAQVGYTLGGDHRTLSRALLRMKVGYTPHDLRRTVATKMSDLGVMPHVIEKCLGHQMVGVMAVYNRAEFLEERKAAWLLWVSRLLGKI